MGKTELKVRAASLAVFVLSLAGITLAQTTGADVVAHLPVWLQAPAGALLLAGVSWLAGRQTRNTPEYLAPSTIEAARVAIERRAPRLR